MCGCIYRFSKQPFRGHAASHRSISVVSQYLQYPQLSSCLFKLPVTFPATQLFHTGWPTGYRDRQLLSWHNRQLLSVEKHVKLHFSMKAMFSGEAAVFSYRPSPQKLLSKDFFLDSVIILYNNSPAEKENRLTVLSHHQGLQLKY